MASAIGMAWALAHRTPILAVAACAAGLASCSDDHRPPAAAIADAQRAYRTSLAPAPVDADVDPCEDFYRYACNPWMNANPPRPDRPIIGRGLDGVHERSRLWLWERLSAEAGGESGPQAATFYASCMDDAAAAQRALRDVAPVVDAINAGSDARALLLALAALHRVRIPALFAAVVDRDWDAPGQSMVVVGPTTLPPPAFADTDINGRRRMKRYTSYVTSMLGQLDAHTEARAGAARVLFVERRLAAALPPPAAGRPFDSRPERLERGDFDGRMAPLPFAEYLAATGLGNPAIVGVVSVPYLEAVRELLTEHGTAVQDYLRWALVRALAPHVPGAVRDTRFTYERTDRRPRWQQCVEATEAALPDEVAALYEAEAVSADTRAATQAIAEAIQRAAVRRLEGSAWLDADARRAATDKVGRMRVLVGLPASAAAPLPIRRDAYLVNLLAAHARLQERMVAQLDSGPDPRVDLAPTSTANAFYRSRTNDVVVPLAIAQAPYFDATQPAAANFGALGAVIGHEIGHAFDRYGRQVDADGRSRDWLSRSQDGLRTREICLAERLAREEAAPRYDQRGDRAAALVAAASVDAERTVDEHLADVAGIAFAHDAFREHAAVHGRGAAPAATSDDRAFFLADAQSWCTSVHPLAAHWLARVDHHVPAPARVNATVAQFPAFADAYDCAAGAALRPSQTCDVW